MTVHFEIRPLRAPAIPYAGAFASQLREAGDGRPETGHLRSKCWRQETGERRLED